MKWNWETLSHRAFLVGILLKGFDGLVEIASGAILLLTSHEALTQWVIRLSHQELVEDPYDFIANMLAGLTQHVSSNTQHFAGIYLLGHGLIKAGLVVGLLRKVTWTYPAALLLLLLFIIYQTYRVIHLFSITLTLLTAVDLVIFVLIYHEWRNLQAGGGKTA